MSLALWFGQPLTSTRIVPSTAPLQRRVGVFRARKRALCFAAVKIYTRSGDEGESSLFNGERVSKTDPIFEALGHVDELNSSVGLAREYVSLRDGEATLLAQLETIQSRLLDVGSAVATPRSRSEENVVQRVVFDPTATDSLESWMDAMDSELPPLTQFILPSGGLASAQLHMSRSICRRAERAVVPFAATGDVESSVAVFMNRLSDYFFVAARFMAMKSGQAEQTYKKATP